MVENIGKLYGLSPKTISYLDVFCTIQRADGCVHTSRRYIEQIQYDFLLKTGDMANTVTLLKKKGLVEHVKTHTYRLNSRVFGAIIHNPYSSFLVVSYDVENSENVIVSKNFKKT